MSTPSEPTLKADVEVDGNTCCTKLLCCERDEFECPSTCCTITIQSPPPRVRSLKPPTQTMN